MIKFESFDDSDIKNPSAKSIVNSLKLSLNAKEDKPEKKTRKPRTKKPIQSDEPIEIELPKEEKKTKRGRKPRAVETFEHPQPTSITEHKEKPGSKLKQQDEKQKKSNPWTEHVKAVASKQKISYKEAMKIAKATYKK